MHDAEKRCPPGCIGRFFLIALGGISLLGLVVRLVVAWRMPLLGDEIGTWIYMASDYRFILTHFREPWLSMGPFIAGIKWWAGWFGQDPLVLRVPVILAGVLSVPVAAGVVLRLRGSAAMALTVALLMAVNPYLVSFGITLRSYSMVVLFCLSALYFLLRWIDHPDWWTGTGCAASCACALLSHACTLYYLVFLGFVFFYRQWSPLTVSRLRATLRNSISLIVPVVWLTLLAGASYLPQWAEMSAFKKQWEGPAPTLPTYIPYGLESYFASGWLLMPAFILLVSGWIYAVRYRPPLAILIGAGAVIPMFIYAASGAQHYPWGSTRLLIYVLPLLLIQISFGLFDVVSASWPRVLVLILLLGSWWPGLHAHYRAGVDQPWSEIAAIIQRWARPHDAIIVPGNDVLALKPFFRHAPELLVPASDYLNGSGENDNTDHRLFFVTSHDWKTDSVVVRKGCMSITMYTGRNRKELATRVVRDLLQNMMDRANPSMTATVMDSLSLMDDLGWDKSEVLKVQRIYYHSVIQDRDGLHLPPSQRVVRFP